MNFKGGGRSGKINRILHKTMELALSGLPLRWNAEQKELLFGPEEKVLEPAVRRLGEMRAVLYPEGEPGEAENERILYFMYRALGLTEHDALFKEKGIRYDVTVLIPGSIGAEYIKTAGHYHPLKPGAHCTYPEVYEVLHGRACYLMQKPYYLEEPQKGLMQVAVVTAEPGDKVLIPPDFGHVTINPGPDYLVMSNLVAAAFQSDYEPLEEMGGAGYYGLVSDGGGDRQDSKKATGEAPLFIPNPRYASPPPLIKARPQEQPQFSLLKEISQYNAFVANPANFAFLTHPENFTRDFEKYLQNLF